MKNRIMWYMLMCLTSILYACSEIDEYDLPAETLIGEVIDKNTNKPIFTETNGIRIKYEELSWGDTPTPTYSAVRQDGTFQNTKVFRGTYRITPVDGAYFPIEGQEVEIAGEKTVRFVVEPFLNLEILEIVQEGQDVTIKFQISRSKFGFKISDAKVFVSTTNFVGNNSFLKDKPGQKLSPSIDLSKVADETILSTTYTLKVEGLEKGKSYSLRVGARTADNVQKRYNYTEIKQIEVK